MNPQEAKEAFEGYVRNRGAEVGTLSPSAGVDAMLGFYRDVRVDGRKPEQDGDMLLYQWGTHDWGQGTHFELDLTRQFTLPPGGDEDIWQLGLTFRFAPTEPLRALGTGHQWCPSPGASDELAAFVRAHPAMVAVGARRDAMVELRYDCAG